jgi:hypothetical protein
LLPIYHRAEAKYKVPWNVLAAINKVETDFGRNLNESSAGAVGWMQFMPSTWDDYGVDADGDGEKDPNDPWDAIFAAAHYLKESGAQSNIHDAIFAYNHAEWYVQKVLEQARAYGLGGFTAGIDIATSSGCDFGLEDVSITGNGSAQSIAAAADALDAMHLPYAWGGGHIQPAAPSADINGKKNSSGQPVIGLDCSGAVSWVLQHAGLNVPTMDSTGFMSWGRRGEGEVVTIYANPIHVFMKIGNRYFGTSGFGHPEAGGGAAWFTRPVSPGYLSTFTAVHPPGL